MPIDDDVIAQVAARLRAAQESGTPIAPVRDDLADGGVDAAYAVQEANTRHALAHGRRLVGRKIGLTSKAVQEQLGVDSPDFGMLFDDMSLRDGAVVEAGKVLQPKAEAEMAFVINRDLDHPDLTLDDLVAAIEYVLPAIEIVGSRIRDWNIRLLDTIADNASSGLFVLGATPSALDGLELVSCTMEMTRDGTRVSTGTGAACLGNPLNAALWLARTIARVGRPLQAGDIVMSGALGPMVVVAPGNTIEARIEGLGSVRAGFAA
jgi:2-keto-4-pentenoate hydratase